MPAPLQPTKWRVEGCHTLCSLNPRNLPAGYYDVVHSWYEAGMNAEAISRKSDEAEHHLSIGAIKNHKRKHMVRDDQFTPLDDIKVNREEKLSDLQILDKIIQAGAKQLDGKSVRISTEMTLKAMELRLKLTQGSVFDDFMGAVAKAFGGDAPDPSAAPENVGAVMSGDESSQGSEDE